MNFDDPFSSPPRSAGLRASDSDREQAAEALRRHHAEGRLTDAEFEQRVSRCYDARTAGELSQLFADLPRHDLGVMRSSGMPGLLRDMHPFAAVMAAIVALWVVGGALSAAAWGWGGWGPHPHPFFVPIIGLFVVWRLLVRRGRRRRAAA